MILSSLKVVVRIKTEEESMQLVRKTMEPKSSPCLMIGGTTMQERLSCHRTQDLSGTSSLKERTMTIQEKTRKRRQLMVEVKTLKSKTRGENRFILTETKIELLKILLFKESLTSLRSIKSSKKCKNGRSRRTKLKQRRENLENARSRWKRETSYITG